MESGWIRRRSFDCLDSWGQGATGIVSQHGARMGAKCSPMVFRDGDGEIFSIP
jgi:hypothetical protein